MPGMIAPNFLCAKLIYKILTYRFAEKTSQLGFGFWVLGQVLRSQF